MEGGKRPETSQPSCKFLIKRIRFLWNVIGPRKVFVLVAGLNIAAVVVLGVADLTRFCYRREYGGGDEGEERLLDDRKKYSSVDFKCEGRFIENTRRLDQHDTQIADSGFANTADSKYRSDNLLCISASSSPASDDSAREIDARCQKLELDKSLSSKVD